MSAQAKNSACLSPGYILLVDDEPTLLRSASLLLRSAGIKAVETLSDSNEVMPLLARQPATVVILDLNMPTPTGQQLLEQIAKLHPEIPVIIMTAANEIDTAVTCMQSGACDYLLKPVDKQRMVTSVERAIELAELRQEVATLRRSLLSGELQQPEAFADIVTSGTALQGVFQYMESIAPTQAPVLITGETGTGKELFAKAIHTLSGRAGPFVPITVAGLDDNVFSDTLFGHKKGAYTGADQAREGLLATAGEGTVFLDEIGDLSTASQIKLLRLLQEHEYYPLGEDKPRISKARVVVATNVDLSAAIKEGQFRQDLYYRLRGHLVHIPPLRERHEDLAVLAQHFIRSAAKEMGKKHPTAPAELTTLLKAYDFPGNVRELQALLFDAVARHPGGVLSLSSLRQAMGINGEKAMSEPSCESGTLESLFEQHQLPTLKEAETLLIEQALQRAEGNQSIAADLLGISRQALNKRLLRARTKDQ